MILNDMNFENWYTELISDTLWYELLRHYKDETIRKCSEKVYAQLVAEKTVSYRPMTENRKHVYNVVCKLPGDKPKVDWVAHSRQKEKEAEPVIEISEVEIKRRLAEWQNSLSKVNNNFTPRFPLLNEKEEGQEEPKKPVGKPYPYTPLEELRQKELHLRYIRENYEPTNGQPKSNWLPESEWIKNNL